MLIALLIAQNESSSLPLVQGGAIAAVTVMLSTVMALFVKSLGTNNERVDRSTALVVATLTTEKQEAEGRWENERAEKQATISRYEKVLTGKDDELRTVREENRMLRGEVADLQRQLQIATSHPSGGPPHSAT